MTDRLNFETRLEERLRARAALASRPFDAAAIARQAVVVSARRRRIGSLAWPSMRPAFGWLILALLLAIAVLGAIVGVGALLRERPPLPPSVVSNGWIAVSANPWEFGGGENGDIYLVREGISPRRIIGSNGDAVAQECPSFSPEGGRLAYGEAQASGPVTTGRGEWPVEDRAIVVVGVSEHGDPSPPLMRVALPAGQGPMSCPEWSPSGRDVAFRVGAELWIADSASGATRAVPIASVIGRAENELEWSRDGSMIAVGEPGQIRVVHVDGGDPTLIPVGGDVPRSLGWTASDDRLVYLSVVPVDGYGLAVHVVEVDGTNDTLVSPQRPIAPGLLFQFEEAAVSPDGTRVAYLQGSRQCTGDGCGPGPELKPIVIADLDGSNRVEISVPADGLPKQSDGSGFFASGVQWSPDGKRLLLSSIVGVVSLGLASGSTAIVHANGTFDVGLNLEWSWPEVTWQPEYR
jgi:hypothetical protein